MSKDKGVSKQCVVGIQGGKGSFNEQALHTYLQTHPLKHLKVRYLYTTQKVLSQLDHGKIDLGLFAICNSSGGLVDETMRQLGRYHFHVQDKIVIPIHHVLMIKPGVDPKRITHIMAHPQVFAQCQNQLLTHYPHLTCISGEGALIDTAHAAKALHDNKIPETTAILGAEILATIYGFTIHHKNLQDKSNNETTFLVVRK